MDDSPYISTSILPTQWMVFTPKKHIAYQAGDLVIMTTMRDGPITPHINQGIQEEWVTSNTFLKITLAWTQT